MRPWVWMIGLGLVVGGGVWIHEQFVRLERRLRHAEIRSQNERASASADAQHLALQVQSLKRELEQARVQAREESAPLSPSAAVERWIGAKTYGAIVPPAAQPSAWGPAEDEHAAAVARDRKRLLEDRVRAANGLLARRTLEALTDLRASDDSSDVAVVLVAWAQREPEAARAALTSDARTNQGLAHALRFGGAGERRTVLWLVYGKDAAWLGQTFLAAVHTLLAPGVGALDAQNRTQLAALVARVGDRASEPLLLHWAEHEADPRSRGWILHHLVALHETLGQPAQAAVPEAAIGRLLDAALALSRPATASFSHARDETYVVPVMALSAIGTWPRWLEGRRDTVRAIATTAGSLERDGARKALLGAGDPWAIERVAAWAPTLGPSSLLEMAKGMTPSHHDALLVGAIGPTRGEAPWPELYQVLNHLRTRAGAWIGLPEALRDKPEIREVDPNGPRFGGDPALLTHLETFRGGLPPQVADAWFRWLATREGVPAGEIEQASRLRLALESQRDGRFIAMRNDGWRRGLEALLASPAAKRAPHLFVVERGALDAALEAVREPSPSSLPR